LTSVKRSLSLRDVLGSLPTIAISVSMDQGSGHFRMILMCNCGPLVLDAMRDSVRDNFGWDLPKATSL